MGSPVLLLGTPNSSLTHPNAAMLVGSLLEIHNSNDGPPYYNNAINMYGHSDSNYCAPYIDFFMARGTQVAPQAVTRTGYEMDSIGGINFGGFDGSIYYDGAVGLYTQVSSNWTPTNHGACLSIYGTDIGQVTQNQLAQFGGPDPNDVGDRNIIFQRPLNFFGNQPQYPGLFPVASPALIAFRCADNSADASISAKDVTLSGNLTLGTNGVISNSNGDLYFTPFNSMVIHSASYPGNDLLFSPQYALWRLSNSMIVAWSAGEAVGTAQDVQLSRIAPGILGIGTTFGASAISGTLNVAMLIENTALTPTSAATAGTTGQIAWDANWIYVCTNGGPAGSATWKSSALTAV